MPERLDLLETLRAGLPKPDGPAKHVVIVGAGIAGLTAGMLLKEAGHTVTILEARNRLGGRIYTYRGFAGGMYGEFGAMRFPRQHHLGQHLIHERFRLHDDAVPDGRRGHVHPPQRQGASGAATSSPRLRLQPAARRARQGPRRHPQGRDAAAHRPRRPAGRLAADHRAATTATRCWATSWSAGQRAGALADGTAAQPRGPLPLLAGRVVRPLARGRVRRPRVHRRRRGHAARTRSRRCCIDDTRFGAEVHAIDQGPDDVVVHFQDGGRHVGVGDRRRVHPDRAARAPPAHGDRRPGRRQVVHDPQRLLRPGAQDLHAVQPAAGGSTTTRSPTA